MHALELLFVVALALYSAVIWTHWWNRKTLPSLRRWMLWTFGIALTCDVSGTVFLCAAAATKWIWNFHTITGTASVAIMGLHFAWAMDATLFSRGRCAEWFNRFSLWAWLLWLSSFVSGIPRH